jgi:phosphoribosyl 1,2-cyclic phosphodiesterase
MRFALFGSGSKGNATLIEHGKTRVLVDCGFSVRELERRMARLGVEGSSLSAILLTHEHNDHLGGAGALARKFKLPIWLTAGTARAAEKRLGELPERHLLNCHAGFSVGELSVQPFPVPHDAREPCQFVFSNGASRLGMLTDTGLATPHILKQLSGCDALILECNHDREMLRNGPYPPHLQQRVASALGHLSNEQAAAILQQLDTSALKHLVAAHLSETNNAPELAAAALSEALGCETDWIAMADQENGLSWREIN